ncbi:MAG TPA: GGDEF domain-containing protein [Thermoanaerobaculia bacterium]|nr:GGDEF domain-containing protein [Thermoanaerobaculia bacterium]
MRKLAVPAHSFRELIERKNARALVHAALLVLAFSPLFMVLDWLTMRFQLRMVVVLGVVCAASALIVGVLARWRSKSLAPYSGEVSIGLFWLVGMSIVITSLLHDGYESPHWAGLYIAIIAVSQIFLWTTRQAMLAYGLLYGAFLAPMALGWIEVHEPVLVFEQQFFLFSTLVVSFFSQRARLQTERREYLGRLRQVRMSQRLRRQATTDALTGLANRRSFIQQSRRELARATRSIRPVSVLAIDVDHFKRINDSYGHAVGDAVLRELARRLGGAVREGDLVARTGGEELSVLLPDTSEAMAVRVAEKLRRAIADAPVAAGSFEVPVTVSLGVGSLGPGCAELDALLAEADRALYTAKRSGRNRVASNARPMLTVVRGQRG